MQKISISEHHKKILKEHAENENPNESCAILFGDTNENNTTVKEVFLTENIENSPVNFTVSNEQLIEGYKIAEEKNMQVIGIFHSHPDSKAYPSNTDKKFMHSNPVIWVIYSGSTKEFKAYVLESDIIEITIQVQN